VCGDGAIDPGEQCDDANDVPTDGCDACAVVCTAPNELLDPSSSHCYLHDPLATSTWDAARAACVAWGGDLVAIGDDEEQALLQTFVAASSWIGATDVAVEGVFAWSNGEPLSYTSWNPGEPNDSNGEDCGEIYGPGVTVAPFLWNDLACDQALSAVCERPPPSGS
jgi:C-type mannose receptor